MFLLIVSSIGCSWLQNCKSKYLQCATLIALIGFFDSNALGVLGGLFLKMTGVGRHLNIMEGGFTNVFFIVLLPPIIFESAYNTNKVNIFKKLSLESLLCEYGNHLSFCVLRYFPCSSSHYSFNLFLGILRILPSKSFLSLNILKLFTFYEAAAYGSLISATDPVSVIAIFKEIHAEKNLFSIVINT